MCSGRVSSSCSTSDTRRVYLVTNPVISREWGKENHNPEMFRIHSEYDFHHWILMESSVWIETGTAREFDPGYVLKA
jgi:hypothetical protein